MKLVKKEMIMLLSNYDIGEVISYKKTKAGVCNHNWIVKTSKGAFVLRGVSKFKKLSEIKFEFAYLDYFYNHNFPYEIPTPVKSKKSGRIVKFKNTYFWVYPFISGKMVRRFGRAELKSVARMMARYHHILENSRLNNSKGCVPFNRGPILKELKQFKKKCLAKKVKQRHDKIFLSRIDDLIRILENLDSSFHSRLKCYPVHRDINPDNVLFRNRKAVALIDFDNISFVNEPLVKDIVVLLLYSCRVLKNKSKLDLGMSRFFIKEYKKHHKLSAAEIKLIPDFALAGAIEDFGYAFWLLENDPERAKLKFLNQYIKMIDWISKNRDMIVKALSV